ncbi:ABC transporter ATP-binding protein [Kibdelosporangium persicum]|uniref:Fused ATPase and permease components of ABC-type multidrug transport system n=1 Tax=Kibdelosporangium persicum TaxID=2698649 RepID=A0ABX2F461_9PSEU|nr:ABC transporter ATP-binding protein [Kibdelosporangium persicum]NRN66113.1 Fused ATPase and permease components of ABC-type multidrug transport system [Kibdelosporangium persicum]
MTTHAATEKQITGRQVLRGAISGQRGHVSFAALGFSAHQAGEAVVPVLIGVVIDQAIGADGSGRLFLWLGILAAVFAVLSYSYRFGARAAERAAEQAAHHIRLGLAARVLDPRGGAESGRLPGELASLATGDAQRVGAFNRALPYGIAAVAGVVVTAVALLRESVPLGLLVLLGTPPLLWLAHLLGRPLERRSEAERDRAANASGVAADLVSGLRVLKGLGAERVAVDRYRKTSQESLAATVRSARAKSVHDGGMLALNGIFLAIVALVGGRLAAEGSISIGALVAAVGLAQFLLGPLTNLSWVNSEYAQARASATRIASVLSAPPAVQPGTEKFDGPVRGEVALRGVSHAGLKDIDLHAAPGELLGVVAPDPAIAVALLECLGRDVDPVTGTVEVDAVALSSLEFGEARGALLIAAHDADLFEGSLIGNVTSNGDGAERALAAAGADEVARALPEGVDTVLTERGRSLSGGQRQRVALARALAADPPVLVLHDPTTAVDAVTEAGIAEGLREIRRGKTTIVVTTSPALLSVADRVVVIEDGKVSAQGSHGKLAAEHAGYRTAVLT